MEDVKRPWLRGQICRGDAEDMLTLDGLTDGLFLIRQTTRNPDDYVLTLVFDRRIYHYLIRKEDAKYRCAQGPPFDNLDDLVRYFRQHDDGLYTYLLRPCTVQSYSRSAVVVSIDQDDGETTGVDQHDSDSEQAPAANQGGIFDKLKCFTEVSDDGLRQTFIVQMMGRKEVSDGLQHIKQNITSIISKAASKGKRKPVILMVSGEGLKVLDSKKKTIIAQCLGEDVICCMQSKSKPKHFAAILSSPVAAHALSELKFTIWTFKNHLGSVGSIEDIASLVTGLIERHSTLAKDDKDIGIPPITPVATSNQIDFDNLARFRPASPRLPLKSPRDLLPTTMEHVDRPLARLRLSPVPRRSPLKKQEAVDRSQAPPYPAAKPDVLYYKEVARRSSLPMEFLSPTACLTDDDRLTEIPHDDTTGGVNNSPGTGDVQYVNVPARSSRSKGKLPRSRSEDVEAKTLAVTRRAVVSSPSHEELDAITASLPSGWQAYWSDREQHVYYYNHVKKLSSWKKPKRLYSDS